MGSAKRENSEVVSRPGASHLRAEEPEASETTEDMRSAETAARLIILCQM